MSGYSGVLLFEARPILTSKWDNLPEQQRYHWQQQQQWQQQSSALAELRCGWRCLRHLESDESERGLAALVETTCLISSR